MAEGERIIPINLEDQMRSSYIDYSMSVIVSRALPDVRDGLKPVHRRVLYGMDGLGLNYNKSYKKSARIVGEVLGKYHPHGDGSVYDAMVRMAQEWSLRYPLVEGQGNFGSIDGDSPAAMRYTEARLQRVSEELLQDIEKDTVDFQFNFDDSLEEPTVLPAKLPNLLINGASGIAVGMATNMLPHNLNEVIDATTAYIDDRDITIEGMMEHIKGPDFPTGGIIYGVDGCKDAFETGRGRIVVRAKAEIQEKNNRETIIVTEIPYQVNKSNLIIKIADLVNQKRIEGISDIRDESDRDGMRIVIEVKRDAMASVVLSKLYKYTPLQTSYGVNNIALVNGRPELLNVKQIIEEFVKFRLQVIIRRTKFDLAKAEARAHILEGLLKALDMLDQIIALIRSSRTVEDAKLGLMGETPFSYEGKVFPFDFSELQAKAILEMRLQKLTGLEREKLQEEYDAIMKKIEYFKRILNEEDLRYSIIKDELAEIKERYGDERRTRIEFAAGEINIEDMIADEDVVITISHLGYIKRTKMEEYRVQGRGGVGARGTKTRSEDFVEHMFVASNHNYILFFTELGRCYWMRCYEIPEAGKASSGRAIQNLIQVPKEDKVKAYIKISDLKDEEFLDSHYLFFATKGGIVKKTPMRAFSRPRTNGINAISFKEGDQLLEVRLTDGNKHILLGTKSGRAIRFEEEKVRSMGRTATGVKGVVLDDEHDEVIGMVTVDTNEELSQIMTLSENGYGKRTPVLDYRITNRGGKGVKTQQLTEKTGQVISLKGVVPGDQLIITNKSGITIRMNIDDVSVTGRATQGVRVIRLQENDSIADVTVIPFDVAAENDSQDESGNENTTSNDNSPTPETDS